MSRRERFEAVFREVYEPLQVYARRRTDPMSADDVVADALLVLWRRLDDVPEELVLPWAYGVTRRCLANHRRGDRRRDALVERVAAEPDGGSVAAADVDPDLSAALAGLEADDRELVRLWAWEQLRPREIALVLDITPNAASIRLHRAKQRLAALLDQRGKSADAAGHTAVGHTEEAS